MEKYNLITKILIHPISFPIALILVWIVHFVQKRYSTDYWIYLLLDVQMVVLVFG